MFQDFYIGGTVEEDKQSQNDSELGMKYMESNQSFNFDDGTDFTKS
jgi:hypothetical protein